DYRDVGLERLEHAHDRAPEKAAAAGHRDAALGPEVRPWRAHVPSWLKRETLPASLSSSSAMSASTIIFTSSSNETFGFQPSRSAAFDASPRSSSTSDGRK